MKNTSVGLATFAVASTVAVTQDVDAKATSVESNVEINKILEDSTDAAVKAEFVEEETAKAAEVKSEFVEEEVDVQHDIAENVINELTPSLKQLKLLKDKHQTSSHNSD